MDLIETGIKIADTHIYHEDRIWSRFSNDKVDIGEQLARVIRTVTKALPLATGMTALSIGSSAEPQFRILETTFRGGLYLLDVDKAALGVVKERIRRQYTGHVVTIPVDYNKVFLDPKKTEHFRKTRLRGKRMNLITLHHSLYYSDEDNWLRLFENLYNKVLAPKGAIHAVLMASKSNDMNTTTWLYDHFVGKFFGYRNNQNLRQFKNDLIKDRVFKKAQILSRTDRVRFFVNDFAKFMAVVWMILLYPDVHQYSLKQKKEITEFVYKEFWRKKRPLIQEQDHLAIYRGIGFKGLV